MSKIDKLKEKLAELQAKRKIMEQVDAIEKNIQKEKSAIRDLNKPFWSRFFDRL
jgi:hypothetical protein